MKAAVSLAKQHDAEILALHMLELNKNYVSSTESSHPEQTVFLLKLAEKRFKEFLEKPYLDGIKATPIIKHYKVFSDLNQVAQNTKADLIIMGSHGSDGLKELFIGSNAERVVRNADIPVIVVKEEVQDFKVERFVFACDFKKENLSAFKKAKNFAKLLSAQLEPVFINTPGETFLSNKDAYLRINEFLTAADTGEQVEIYNDYSVKKGVLNYSASIMADLVGIPTHGRKGLSHFFMGSIGEDIANHSKAPVITFKI